MHWNLVFSSGVQEESKKDRDVGTGRYTSTRALIIEYMKKAEHVRLARYRAFSDTWVGWLPVSMHLEGGYTRKAVVAKD